MEEMSHFAAGSEYCFAPTGRTAALLRPATLDFDGAGFFTPPPVPGRLAALPTREADPAPARCRLALGAAAGGAAAALSSSSVKAIRFLSGLRCMMVWENSSLYIVSVRNLAIRRLINGILRIVLTYHRKNGGGRERYGGQEVRTAKHVGTIHLAMEGR